MIALLWTAVSIVGLFAYVTIAITTCRVTGVYALELERRDPSHFVETDAHVAAGIFWPLVVPAFAIWWVCYKTSRGPAAWSIGVADWAERRVSRKSDLKAALKDRDTRIAELEHDLQIGENS